MRSLIPEIAPSSADFPGMASIWVDPSSGAFFIQLSDGTVVSPGTIPSPYDVGDFTAFSDAGTTIQNVTRDYTSPFASWVLANNTILAALSASGVLNFNLHLNFRLLMEASGAEIDAGLQLVAAITMLSGAQYTNTMVCAPGNPVFIVNTMIPCLSPSGLDYPVAVTVQPTYTGTAWDPYDTTFSITPMAFSASVTPSP